MAYTYRYIHRYIAKIRTFSLSVRRRTDFRDAYAGIAYSNVSGGLAIAIPHGPGVPYNYNNNVAPTVGARFTF